MSTQSLPNLPNARCKGQDTELFFLDPTPVAANLIRAAKRVCEGCPDRAPCLEYALEHNEEGIWGGLTKQQRAYLGVRYCAHCNRRYEVPRGQRRSNTCSPECARARVGGPGRQTTHGTPAGYRWHNRHKDKGPVCGPCAEAGARDTADKKARYRAQAAEREAAKLVDLDAYRDEQVSA